MQQMGRVKAKVVLKCVSKKNLKENKQASMVSILSSVYWVQATGGEKTSVAFQ